MKFGTMKLSFLALVIRCKHLPVLRPPLLTGELSCSYMRPGTPHYVVTVEDAIVYGNHFFATSTSQPTAFGIIHCFIMGYTITNQLHDDLFTFLRRQMAMWFTHFEHGAEFNTDENPHVPDVMKQAELLDLIAIGNIIELSTIIDRRCYKSHGIHHLELAEMGASRLTYRRLRSLIAQKFVLTIAGKPVHPLLLFQRLLVEFAAAIVVYKETAESSVPPVPGCTAEKVKEKTITFFELNYPHLLPRLHSLIYSRYSKLCWDGPKIAITPRTEAHCFFGRKRNTPAMAKNEPRQDFSDQPIFIENMKAAIKNKAKKVPDSKARRSGSPMQGTEDRKRKRARVEK
jgi:hypothetical protein